MIEIKKDLPTHYRYEEWAYKEKLEIKATKFYPVGETKCFYLVVSEHEMMFNNPRVRRAAKNALRGYCKPSLDEALHSYKKRKESQVGHNEYALAKAKAALNCLEGVKSGLDSFDAGRPDYWDNLNFD